MISSMKRTIIKFCYPIIYTSLLLPIIWVILFTIVLSDVTNHFYGLSNWLVEAISLVSLLLIFWLVNKILTTLENSTRPTIGDHYRQSAILYIIMAAFLKTVFFNEYNYGFSGWFSFGTAIISLLLIIINAMYVYWRCRVAFVTRLPLASTTTNASQSLKIGLLIFIGPIIMLLIMLFGYYINQYHSQIQYGFTPSNGTILPGTPLPPTIPNQPTSTIITSTGTLRVNKF